MIGIFNNKTTKTDLTLYNGEYILDSVCTSYEITEELNGEYSLDINFLISDKVNKKAYDLLVNDSLLKVDDEYGIEYFRIAKVTKTKTRYEIFARHITISEPLKMFCEDVRPTSLNGQGAISWIANNSRGNKWIEFSSNIANVNTAYYKNKTVYEALFDADNSFLNRWGGEVYRRGFKLSINTKVGEDRGFSIRSGKNLKGIEERSNLNTLVTSIYPTGFDGISIPEKYINSTNIDYYSDIYPKEVKFEDVKVKSEDNEEGFDTLEEAQEELRKRAKEMFDKDKVDVLTSSYTVTFAELQKAEGYKDYSFLETTFLGDIVSVFEEKLGININVRVTKRVYDGIKKRRKSTTLSNKDLNYKPPSITQIIDKINKVDSTETVLQIAKDNATALIKSGLKNSYVVVRENEILIGDTKDINTMIKVWRWNNAGLGFSSTGYYGEYGTAITNDGAIVADFITTGILNAVLIKTGLLKSFNGKSWLNMDDGTFNFADKIKFDGTSFTIDLSSEDLTTNESLKVMLKVMNDSISSKVSNGDFTTYKEQTATSISSKVASTDFESYKTQTATEISSKVANLDFNSYKTQTATTISQKISKTDFSDSFGTEFSQTVNAFNFDIGSGTTNVKINKNGIRVKNGAIELQDSYGTTVLKGTTGGDLLLKGNYIKIKDDLVTSAGAGMTLTRRGLNFTNINGGSVQFYMFDDEECLYISNNGTYDKRALYVSRAYINNLESAVMSGNLITGKTISITEGISCGTGGSFGSKVNAKGFDSLGYAINTSGGSLSAGSGSLTCGGATINGSMLCRAIDTDGYPIKTYGGSISTSSGSITCGMIDAGTIYSDDKYVVVSNGSYSYQQVKGMAMRYGSGSDYLEIQTRDYSLYGVTAWSSDIKLKENIELVETSKPKVLNEINNKIGLDAVLNIDHYSFDYKNKPLNHTDCGYIAQQLIEVNKNFAYNVKQEDGTDIYCPDPSALIPTLSLAIKEQQEHIKTLEERIEKLEGLINGK